MKNENVKKNVLEFTNEDGFKTVIELPWDNTMEDLCQAFLTLCVGMTYMPSTVLRGMYEFAKEMGEVEDPEYFHKIHEEDEEEEKEEEEQVHHCGGDCKGEGCSGKCGGEGCKCMRKVENLVRVIRGEETK